MLTVRERVATSVADSSGGRAGGSAAADRLVLPFELRQKSRLRARLESGAEVGLFLERGIVLRGGDLLLADDGTLIEVIAAPETVSTVQASDATQLARAGYHLGNRHVPVEIGSGWLRYGHDHVLDDMMRGLGLEVVIGQAPFEPEAGAYGHSLAAREHGHDHHHGHTHSHGDSHTHDHGDGHTGYHSHGNGHEPARSHLHDDNSSHGQGSGRGHAHEADRRHDTNHQHEADRRHEAERPHDSDRAFSDDTAPKRHRHDHH